MGKKWRDKMAELPPERRDGVERRMKELFREHLRRFGNAHKALAKE